MTVLEIIRFIGIMMPIVTVMVLMFTYPQWNLNTMTWEQKLPYIIIFITGFGMFLGALFTPIVYGLITHKW